MNSVMTFTISTGIKGTSAKEALRMMKAKLGSPQNTETIVFYRR